MRTLRAIVGGICWIGLFAWVGRLATEESEDSASTFAKLLEFYSRAPVSFDVRFSRPTLLEVGDGVYVDGGAPRINVRDSPIGEIEALCTASGRPTRAQLAVVSRARVVFFDRSIVDLRADASARLLNVPSTSAEWVLDTLVTEDNARRVREEWRRSIERHRDEILELLRPVGRSLLAEIEETFDSEARIFLRSHRSRVDALVGKLESDLDSDKLAQLFESEVWPIMRRRLDPVFERIGAAVWDRMPVWGLAWRLAYQQIPFTADDHFARHWKGFIDGEVVPIVRSHAPEILEASKLAFRDTIANPRVSTTIREAVVRRIEDPDLHGLVSDFVREVFVDNERFHDRLGECWQAPDTRRALDRIAEILEHTVRRIGDMLLGTREEGITPEFARVLRAQILEKDARRLLVAPGTASLPPLEPGAMIPAVVESEVAR